MLRLNELKNSDHTMWQTVKEVGKNFPSPYVSLFCAAYAFRGHGPSCRSSWLRQRNALTGKAWEDTVEGLGNEKIRFWIVVEAEAFKNTQHYALTKRPIISDQTRLFQ